MDNKQRQSIIRHISQKLFINKVSKINFLSYVEKDAHETMRDIAGESLTAAKIYAEEIELDSQFQDIENETNVLT